MLAASFQVKGQYSITFGNKSHCDMEVEIVTCNSGATNVNVPINTPQTFNFSNEIEIVKINYGGILTFIIQFNSSCMPLSADVVTAATSPCYVHYYLSGTQTTGFDFSVW